MATLAPIAVGLPAVGEFSYNNFQFGGAEKISVKGKREYDEAGRTVMYVRYTITVEAIVAGDTTADLQTKLASMHRLLTHPGGQLKLLNKGFGNNLTVNSPAGGTRDVMWGPKPLDLEVTPIGSSQAAHVIFTIETCIPECECGTCARSTGVMAINYDVHIAIDKHGDTTRTISGYILIAQTRRKGSPDIKDDADQYWELIAPPAVFGFDRKSNRHLSKDKCRLDFSITDQQIPSRNPYPTHVVEISGSHRVMWTFGTNKETFAAYINTISVDITPSSLVQGVYAWLVFTNILGARRLNSPRYSFLLALDVEEDLFGRASSFSATYRVNSTYKEFLDDTQLFRPLGGTWEQHSKSVQPLQSSRGTWRWKHDPRADKLIDLCPTTPLVVYDNANPIRAEYPGPTARDAITNKAADDPADSWLMFRSTFYVDESPCTTKHAIIQQGEDVIGSSITDAKRPDFGQATGIDDIIQRGGRTRYQVVWSGIAKRAGRPIPKPRLTKIGTINVTASDVKFHSEMVGDAFGVPVYEARWVITYDVPNHPGVIFAPDKPDEKIFSETTKAKIVKVN